MSNSEAIELRHLPAFLQEPRRVVVEETGKIALEPLVELNLHALEARAIRNALARAGENRTQAAELLGISRRTLQRKLKEMSLER
jgi:transcriptional regulator with PAS, ATPase and Fis domain